MQNFYYEALDRLTSHWHPRFVEIDCLHSKYIVFSGAWRAGRHTRNLHDPFIKKPAKDYLGKPSWAWDYNKADELRAFGVRGIHFDGLYWNILVLEGDTAAILGPEEVSDLLKIFKELQAEEAIALCVA